MDFSLYFDERNQPPSPHHVQNIRCDIGTLIWLKLQIPKRLSKTHFVSFYFAEYASSAFINQKCKSRDDARHRLSSSRHNINTRYQSPQRYRPLSPKTRVNSVYRANLTDTATQVNRSKYNSCLNSSHVRPSAHSNGPGTTKRGGGREKTVVNFLFIVFLFGGRTAADGLPLHYSQILEERVADANEI